jgi:hypothetical protein
MKWSHAPAKEDLIAALNADILQEVGMAEDCLQRAYSAPQPYYTLIRRNVASCAAAALSNATALAAEVLSLGGFPPGAAALGPSRRPAAGSIEEYIILARSAVMHYQNRLVIAERLGLARLCEIFLEIILSKRRHLAHAGLVAAAGPRSRQLS